MRVLITGAGGFLGWHTRLRLEALSTHDVIAVRRANWGQLPQLLSGVDAIIHLAGVNRGANGHDVHMGNVRLARSLADAIRAQGAPIRTVYANSIQAGNGTPYGAGKQEAGQLLSTATERTGGTFVDVLLPNLFGEHGRPGYNSFVATFVHAISSGTTPLVQDNLVNLLHAQDAAQILIQAAQGTDTHKDAVGPASDIRSVREVWDLLVDYHHTYALRGEFPDLSSKFLKDLFNTYRSALFPSLYPLGLKPHSDGRGMFVETARSRGGEGQSAISSTMPGITRGEHYHLQKVERFVVVHGSARIQLRRMFTTEVFSFEVNGTEPVAIDMPTGWVHNLTNIGNDILLTQFWTDELFRPDRPDTFPERVELHEGAK